MSLFNPKCCVCGKNAGITATGNANFKMLCLDCRKKVLSGTRLINCNSFSTEECIRRVHLYDKNKSLLENFVEIAY